MPEMFSYEYRVYPPRGKDAGSAVRYLTGITTREGVSTNYRLSPDRSSLVFSASEPVLSVLEAILPDGYKCELARQPLN